MSIDNLKILVDSSKFVCQVIRDKNVCVNVFWYVDCDVDGFFVGDDGDGLEHGISLVDGVSYALIIIQLSSIASAKVRKRKVYFDRENRRLTH